jgi:hypothetical protein
MQNDYGYLPEKKYDNHSIMLVSKNGQNRFDHFLRKLSEGK